MGSDILLTSVSSTSGPSQLQHVRCAIDLRREAYRRVHTQKFSYRPCTQCASILHFRQAHT